MPQSYYNNIGVKSMKKVRIEFTRELTAIEKQKLLQKFAGCIFNLNDVIKNGFEVVSELNKTDCKNAIIDYYSQFDCKFTDI